MADTIAEEENIDTKNIFGDIKSDRPADYEVRQFLFSILCLCWVQNKRKSCRILVNVVW